MTEADVQAALTRNDRFLALIEQYEFCPFALRCRETGGLFRQVLPIVGPDESAVLDVIQTLERDDRKHVEVGLVLMPHLAVPFDELQRFAVRLRERMKQERLQEFFIVAFHPDSPGDTSTPDRVVGLLRRSPDPTFQLVRASLLAGVRSGGNETRWVDLRKTDLREVPPPPPPSLSERIAAQNAETVQRLSADRLVELLAALRK